MSEKYNSDIQIIMNQTNYTSEEAYEKLVIHNFDKIKVIKEYMGIPLNIDNKTKPLKSINQEIYKQIRKELDISMNAYNKKNPVNISQVIDNFNESDERLEKKN
jgi:hypothetical protein